MDTQHSQHDRSKNVFTASSMAIFMVSIRYISGRVSPFILHFFFRSHGGSKIPISKIIPFPETEKQTHLNMDVWKTIHPFLFPMAYL